MSFQTKVYFAEAVLCLKKVYLQIKKKNTSSKLKLVDASDNLLKLIIMEVKI